MKYLGFYFDGDVNKYADYIINYKNFENNIIHFNNEIPKNILDQIKPGQTRVMNHYQNSTYDNSESNGDIVP